MADRKAIKVSEEVYDRLAEDKGKSTWDDHLTRMHEMAYGVDYFKAPKLHEFEEGGPGGHLGTVQSSPKGTIEFVLRLRDGAPRAVGVFDEIGPKEEVMIEVQEGEIVEEE